MRCFIIGQADQEERSTQLIKHAEQLGYPTFVQPDLISLQSRRDFSEASRPLVLVSDASPHGALAETTVRFAEAEHGHAFTVYVAETMTAEAYKRLVRSHAGEWIRWDSLARELPEVVRTLNDAEVSSRTAKVFSYLPSKGGVGNTTLALETGVHLALSRKRNGFRVAIVDLNLQGGTLADSLDLQARFNVREIMDRPERFDQQLVDIFASRYSARLDIFAGPIQRIDLRDMDPKVVFSALDGIASQYNCMLLDIPNQPLAWTDNVLQGSDVVIVSGASTVPAMKQLGAKLSHLDEIGIQKGKIAIALNQCDTDILGRVVRRAEVDRAFPNRRVFFIRRDVSAVESALNAGRPLSETASGSRVSKDIAKLAHWVESTTDQPQTAA